MKKKRKHRGLVPEVSSCVNFELLMQSSLLVLNRYINKVLRITLLASRNICTLYLKQKYIKLNFSKVHSVVGI